MCLSNGAAVIFRAVLLGVVTLQVGFSDQAAAKDVSVDALNVLSSRPDMVSGGDVLIAATVPARALSSVKVLLNGSDITSAFRRRAVIGDLVGHVEGLRLGLNT